MLAGAMTCSFFGVSTRSAAVSQKARTPCLLLDRAGWHTTAKLEVPKNITPIFLPSHAPELNPVENFWQYLRANWAHVGQSS
jgi:transposase